MAMKSFLESYNTVGLAVALVLAFVYDFKSGRPVDGIIVCGHRHTG
jgi:hypothetical protein